MLKYEGITKKNKEKLRVIEELNERVKLNKSKKFHKKRSGKAKKLK